jgi:hypothetical protein
MSTTDLAIYLSAHGAAHQWFRAKWLGDLARLHCNGQVDWMDVLAQARSMGEERPVLLALQLLSESFGLSFHSVPTDLRKRLPNLSASAAIRALTTPELKGRNAWVIFTEVIKTYRCNRTLWPYMSWRSVVIYSRLDLGVLCLPDRLFWLYIPLRPLLWLWRRFGMEQRDRIKQFYKKITHRKVPAPSRPL